MSLNKLFVGATCATVDAVGAANSPLYTSNGCTVPSGTIVVASSAWTAGRYTTCTSFDAPHFYALPVGMTNALGQSTGADYDTAQDDVLTSTTDANNKSTSYTA